MEKRGLAEQVSTLASAGTHFLFADELRLGLHGQVRRRWCPVGVKLRQPLEIRYVWRYLILAVDPLAPRLVWKWLTQCRKAPVAEVVAAWQEEGVDGIIWDNAPWHTAKLVRAVGVPLIRLPPYSPELNPAERVFEEIRREVEGMVYASMDDKATKVEAFLKALADDPPRLSRLVGWGWIRTQLANSPAQL